VIYLGWLTWLVGLIVAVGWVYGIRNYTRRGVGVTQQTVNTTMLFFVSLIVTLSLRISPYHLLWLFPLSWVMGTLSLVFPFSLLSIPGALFRGMSCIGLDWALAGGNIERRAKRRAQKYGKGCARAMLRTFNIVKNSYKGEIPTHALLLRETLDARPYWNQVGESFRYKKAPDFDTSLDPTDYSGKLWLTGTIEITDEMSLLDVTQDVLRTELYWFYLRDLEIETRFELMDVALETAEKYIEGADS